METSVTLEIIPVYLECPVCLSTFSDPRALREHMIQEFDIQPELLIFLDADLGIESGDSSPSTYSGSNSEVLETPCHKCHKVCKGIRGFNQHYGKVHVKKKKHAVCKLCASAFRSKYALRFHIKQVHDQATRVQCEICGMVLYNKYMLTRHNTKHHKGQYI